MSSSHPVDTPRVLIGDLLAAINPMRAWRTEQERGADGEVINPGERVLVIGTWLVGNQRRISVICGQQILLLSCADHTITKNWRLIRRG